MECLKPFRRYVSSVPLPRFRKLVNSPGYDCLVPFNSLFKDPRAEFSGFVDCGQCISCRVNKQSEMTVRGVHEQKLHPFSFFITLTYDDDHIRYVDENGVPYKYLELTLDRPGVMVDDFGEIRIASFWKSDLESFFKRLRSWLNYHHPGSSFRFLSVGEYGDVSNRPHFHFICYTDVDLQKGCSLWGMKNGYPIWLSPDLMDLWYNGNVMVEAATVETIAYVCRYTLKKLTGKKLKNLDRSLVAVEKLVDGKVKTVFESDSNPPEQIWFNCSRRPGIGIGYVAEHADDIAAFGKIWYVKGDGVKVQKLPRTYLAALERFVDEDSFAMLKDVRAGKAEGLRDEYVRSIIERQFSSNGDRLRYEEEQKRALERKYEADRRSLKKR